MHEKETSMMGTLCAVPWCCLLPGGLALLGVSGVTMLATVSAAISPYLLGFSALCLGWAHYILHIKHHGNRLSRIITWSGTSLVVAMLALRFGM